MKDFFIDPFFNSAGNAWINVMVWVALSLLFFETLNFFSREKFIKWIEKLKLSQPLIASILGIIPGCGATLFLVPLYNKRKITFGALTASFISTMGDASFIILAGDPLSFLIITVISSIVAIIVGYGLDLSGLSKKLEAQSDIGLIKNNEKKINQENLSKKEKKLLPDWFVTIEKYVIPSLFWIFILFALPGSIMVLSLPGLTDDKIPVSTGIETFMNILSWVGLVSILIFIPFYIIRKIILNYYVYRDDRVHIDKIHYGGVHKQDFKHIMQDTITMCLFMLVWIFIGTFLWELMVAFSGGEDVVTEFLKLKLQIAMIFIGAIIGLIPGCGPQIVFANIFLQGGASGAALMANTISQDGDAGFPLMAVDKRGFILIKILNFIPSLIIGSLMIIPQLNWFTF